MAFKMRFQRRDLGKSLMANVTFMRPCTSVRQHVLFQGAGTDKVAAAHLANVSADVEVSLHVRRHPLAIRKALSTHGAFQRYSDPMRLEVHLNQYTISQ
jgi:hypothetical protein